ncbi:MAG: Na/Pi symporter, partial [Bacillota bacterium]|nr:Na/Pi symporter [Bacillota bacterium]
MITTTLFGLVGGLGLFLFGIDIMAEGLQKSVGNKMRRVLEILTGIPIMGAIMGALVTAVIQSSSATTVMVVGFVNAGLMTLKQAVSVILGANIGTTVTAQLVAFQLTDYA